LTKTYGSESDGLLWRHVTLQRKTAIWVHNYSPSRAEHSNATVLRTRSVTKNKLDAVPAGYCHAHYAAVREWS